MSAANNAFKSPEDFKVSLSVRTNYLFGRIKKSLPEMYAFTVCMWLKSSASPGIGTPFSYGVPGQANEIVLIEWGNNPIELLVNDKVGARAERLIKFKLTSQCNRTRFSYCKGFDKKKNYYFLHHLTNQRVGYGNTRPSGFTCVQR